MAPEFKKKWGDKNGRDKNSRFMSGGMIITGKYFAFKTESRIYKKSHVQTNIKHNAQHW